MKKIAFLTLLGFLSSSLVACNPASSSLDAEKPTLPNGNVEITDDTDEDSPLHAGVPTGGELPETRTFQVASMSGLVQGEVIDLNDYVTVIPGQDETTKEQTQLYYDYDILTDDVNLPVVSTYNDEPTKPTLYKSKKLILQRPGRAVIRLFSLEANTLLTFDVAPSPEFDDVLNYFEEHNLSEYTVEKGFTLNSDMTVTPSEATPTLYKTNNYIYYPESYNGYVFNNRTLVGYPFMLDGVSDEYADTFVALPNGDYDTMTTLSQFRNMYPSLSNFFTAGNLQYNPTLESLFGEKYRFAFPYLDENEDAFLNALSCLGLSYQRILNGSYFYTVYLVPIIDNDELSIYTVSTNSSGSALLEGPYIIDSQPDGIKVLDDFVFGDAPTRAVSTDPITDKLNSNLNNYTAHITGQYYDIHTGEEIAMPEIYDGYLPNFENTTKTTTDAFETNLFNEMDSSYEFSHAIFRNEDGRVRLYEVEDSGDVIDQGLYGTAVDTSWQITDTLSGSSPAQMFNIANFRNIVYFMKDETTYVTSPMNEYGAYGPLRVFIRGLGAPYLVNDASPFYYYIENAYIELDIGATASDDITGRIEIKLPVDDDYVNYVFNFSIYDINATTI